MEPLIRQIRILRVCVAVLTLLVIGCIVALIVLTRPDVWLPAMGPQRQFDPQQRADLYR